MRKNSYGNSGCSIYLFILGLNLVLGTMSVNYILSWFDKSIPLWGACIIGLIGGEITMPVAVIGLLLKCFGVF